MRRAAAIASAPRIVRVQIARTLARRTVNGDLLLRYGRAGAVTFEFSPTPRPELFRRQFVSCAGPTGRSDHRLARFRTRIETDRVGLPIPCRAQYSYPLVSSHPLDDADLRCRENDHQENLSWPEP